VTELPTDDKAHRFQISSSAAADLRPDIFQLMVQKGWIMLELKREGQSLEDVFKTLTKGDERKDRGRRIVEEEDEEEGDDASAEGSEGDGDEEEDDEEEGDEDDADDEDAEEEEAAKASDGEDEDDGKDKKPAKKKG
jgi:ABC-2 type transport system ATP-binding protein